MTRTTEILQMQAEIDRLEKQVTEQITSYGVLIQEREDIIAGLHRQLKRLQSEGDTEINRLRAQVDQLRAAMVNADETIDYSGAGVNRTMKILKDALTATRKDALQ